MAVHYRQAVWRALVGTPLNLDGSRRSRILLTPHLYVAILLLRRFVLHIPLKSLDFRTFIRVDGSIFCLGSRSDLVGNIVEIAVVDGFRGETRIFVVAYITDVRGGVCHVIGCRYARRGKSTNIFGSVDRATRIT